MCISLCLSCLKLSLRKRLSPCRSPGTAGHHAGAGPCGRAARMGTTGQPIQWGLQREGKKVWGGKKGEKELAKAEEGKARCGWRGLEQK